MIRLARSVLAYAALSIVGLCADPAAAQTLVNTAITTGPQRETLADLPSVAAEAVVPKPLSRVVQGAEGAVEIGTERPVWSDSVRQVWAELERFARVQRRAFDSAVVLYQRSPSAAHRLSSVMTDTAVRAVTYALLASDRDEFRQHLRELVVIDTVAVKEDAQSLRESLAAALQRLRSPIVSLFAEGNIRAAATGEGESKPIGTGAVGLKLSIARYSLYASVNVASSHDTLVSGYGAAMLTPATGKSLTSGLLQARREPATGSMTLARVLLPNAFYVSVARSLWSRDTSPARSQSAAGTVEANTIAAAVLRSWDVAAGMVGESPVAFTLQWGWAMRWLTGDIADEDAIRSDTTVLGTNETTFMGPEVGMQISFNHITAALQFYYLFPDKQHVDGLSGGQIAAGIGIAGEIVRDVLRRR